jgi:hypothetical protein
MEKPFFRTCVEGKRLYFAPVWERGKPFLCNSVEKGKLSSDSYVWKSKDGNSINLDGEEVQNVEAADWCRERRTGDGMYASRRMLVKGSYLKDRKSENPTGRAIVRSNYVRSSRRERHLVHSEQPTQSLSAYSIENIWESGLVTPCFEQLTGRNTALEGGKALPIPGLVKQSNA